MNLTFDEAEAIGLDGTGRDMDPAFPHTYAGLSDELKVKFWQFRIMSSPEFKTMDDVYAFTVKLREVASALGMLESAWTSFDLPGDFIVPELGLPISMSVEETSAEIWVLAEKLETAADNVFEYVGEHRGRPAA